MAFRRGDFWIGRVAAHWLAWLIRSAKIGTDHRQSRRCWRERRENCRNRLLYCAFIETREGAPDAWLKFPDFSNSLFGVAGSLFGSAEFPVPGSGKPAGQPVKSLSGIA
jgi:hypothetical protein